MIAATSRTCVGLRRWAPVIDLTRPASVERVPLAWPVAFFLWSIRSLWRCSPFA